MPHIMWQRRRNQLHFRWRRQDLCEAAAVWFAVSVRDWVSDSSMGQDNTCASFSRSIDGPQCCIFLGKFSGSSFRNRLFYKGGGLSRTRVQGSPVGEQIMAGTAVCGMPTSHSWRIHVSVFFRPTSQGVLGRAHRSTVAALRGVPYPHREVG